MTEDERCAAFVRATDEMIALAYAATSVSGMGELAPWCRSERRTKAAALLGEMYDAAVKRVEELKPI